MFFFINFEIETYLLLYLKYMYWLMKNMVKENNLPEVELYSDWWANPNPWRWWYGIILCYKWVKKEFKQWFEFTTNNRMEMTWVITWLSKLKTRSKIMIYTDSQYTINGIKKWWAEKWKKNDWYRTKTEKAVNFDLWEILLDLVSKHDVSFTWVKGHNWHIENERCDELATEAMDMDTILIDKGFIPKDEDLNKSEKVSKDDKNKKDIIKALWKWDPSIKVQKESDPCKKMRNSCYKEKTKTYKKDTWKSLLLWILFLMPLL